jgi:TolB-like protein/class 3 adenylate cyclase/Flp pilus assembly protein TadD
VAEEQKTKLRLEVAHVLFIDIVGYSKLLIDEQTDALQQLNQIVRNTEAAREAELADQLIRLPTGDGMALVFTTSAETPVECAVQISEGLRAQSGLQVRMGVHSGPVHQVADVNERTNIAGAGINIAQRVMDCGDAGHILLSKHVADDLEQYRQWRSLLHDLGECEVKHGVRLHLFNLYGDAVGNSATPEKIKCAESTGTGRSPLAKKWPWLFAAALLIAGALAFGLFRLVGSRAPQSADIAPQAATEKSIAVLPFENLSDEKQNAYFADGVQDEILTDLAKVADLKVISRTSVMQYKSGVARNLREIGRQLGVAHLLEGSVQRAVNRIRVNAQLIDARTDAHLWAQTYDRDLADVFAIQTEIASAIADQLQAKILPRERHEMEKQPTKDLAAYDLYLRGIAEFEQAPQSDQPKDHLLAAIALLEQAVQRDPAFIAAYCRLGRAHDVIYLFGEDHTPARLALAEQAINTALQLQPDSPEAHLARADYLYSKLDYEGARAEIAIARRSLPNNVRAFELSGYIDRRQGRWEESTRNLQRAIELDPNNVFLLQQIASSYEAMRQYANEVALLDRAISLRPDDLDTRLGRAQIEVFWKANPRPMRDVIASAISRDPANAHRLATTRVFLAFAERDADSGLQALADLGEKTFGPNAFQFPRAAGDGIFARLKGDTAAAQASFARARAIQEKIVMAQPDYAPAVCILGLIDAVLGRKEDALREAARAAELMPPSKDSINGAHLVRLVAMIYAWLGEKDRAIDQLQRAVQIPAGGSYGELKLFPQWDPLRGDPRFESIIASLAPKD